MALDIVMYGNEISTACHGRRFKSHSLRILVQQMLYHRKPDTTRKTLIAIGFNASLNAYKIWAPPLVKLRDEDLRIDEITKWLAEMEAPDEFMLKFVEQNNVNANGLLPGLKDNYDEEKELAVTRRSEVKELPMEDTVWLIEELFTVPDEAGRSWRHLAMRDKHTHYIGFNHVNTMDQTLTEHCHDLVYASTLYPKVGMARRPAFITFKDPVLAKDAVDLDLEQYGINYMYAGLKKEMNEFPFFLMRECCVCRLRGTKELFKKCSSCHAMLYCSKVCQKKDWARKGKEEPHSHKKWCAKMKQYMQKTEILREFPFTYAQETTCGEFDQQALKTFLECHGVYNQGAWRRECQLWRKHGQMIQFGDLENTDNPIVLPVEGCILDDSPTDPPFQVVDWESYYTYRGFRLDSPIAVLLQFPLTIFHIVKYCLPNDCPDWWDGLDGSELHIDIVGVEKEVEMLPIFTELGHLLPEMNVDIHMYGNEISKQCDGMKFESHNVKVTVHQQLFHRRSDDTGKPHLVIGFNAGLGAYVHWGPTLVKLRTDKIPAYFTDYCQYSCECAKIAVEGLGIGTISPVRVNPFRSPVRKIAEENDMPWYSNGFYYNLIYPR